MIKEDVESQLGFLISDKQFDVGMSRAKQKLQSIIRHYGDADGVRRTPEYLAELVTEAIAQELFSEYTRQVSCVLLDANQTPTPVL